MSAEPEPASSTTASSSNIPEEFIKVMGDFARDLMTTFPEYRPLIQKWWKEPEQYAYIEEEEDRTRAFEKARTKSIKMLFEFCKQKLPPRFFAILYKVEDIFAEGSQVDTEFLPNIHFKNLWQFELSDKTRETIWKYLQLLVFSIIGTLEDTSSFGDAANLFEAINQDEFRQKLQDTLAAMQGCFDASGNGTAEPADTLPDADKLNERINAMLGGKIGQLAKEIAEELDLGEEESGNPQDMFMKFIKNPAKLMGMMKTVGDKLQTKLDSGEIKESEMIQEAVEMMNSFKDIPGMASMFGKMGMGGGSKMNPAATGARLNQMLKKAQTKERIRAKALASAAAKQSAATATAATTTPASSSSTTLSEEELIALFQNEPKAQRTPRKPTNGSGNKGKTKK